MLFHTLPGYSPLDNTDEEEVVAANDTLANEGEGEALRLRPEGSPRVTLSDLKQLCLICGMVRDEKEEHHNQVANLAVEVHTVFRYYGTNIYFLEKWNKF